MVNHVRQTVRAVMYRVFTEIRRSYRLVVKRQRHFSLIPYEIPVGEVPQSLIERFHLMKSIRLNFPRNFSEIFSKR